MKRKRNKLRWVCSLGQRNNTKNISVELDRTDRRAIGEIRPVLERMKCVDGNRNPLRGGRADAPAEHAFVTKKKWRDAGRQPLEKKVLKAIEGCDDDNNLDDAVECRM